MEGSNRGDDSSSRRGSSDASKKKGSKRKTVRVASFPQPLPPEIAAQYLSQATAAAAAAWEKNAASNQGDKTYGPNRPPSKSASLSFGSLDLAALAQSGSLDFAAAAAAANRSGGGENGQPPCSEAEMKALMSMFVEIMGMSMDPDNNSSSSSSKARSKSMSQAAQNFLASNTSGGSNGSSSFPVFMFGNSGSGSSKEIPPPPGGWPSSAAAAAAAAGVSFPPDESSSWGVDYYDDDEETDDDDDDESIPDLEKIAKSSSNKTATKSSDIQSETDGGFSPAALAALEQVEMDDALQEEERARKAAKKREKKQRKKEKAKKEAALKAFQAAQKKREKLVLSWRSRVVSACQSNEVTKLESLLSESPLRPPKTHEETEEDSQAFIKSHMEFLLPNCIAKNRQQVEKGREARQKLAEFIMNWSIPLVLTCGRNGRSAFHTACFNGDVYFVQLVLERAANVRKEDSSSVVTESYANDLCENSGWSPLHYAVVSGSMHVAEALMTGGCDIHKSSDKTKTWRISNGNGITARELAEIVRSGKQDKILDTNGDSLTAIAETHFGSTSERNRFIRVLEKTVARLTDVEENGYSPPKDPLPNLKSNGSQEDDETKLAHRSSSISEDTTKKKKKKKKKEKQQQQPECEPSKPAKSSAVPAKQEDPMISALIGMGFSREQISAAAKACGGYDRATADDLVMWIFAQESGETDTAAPAESAGGTTDANTNQTDNTNDAKELNQKNKETQEQRDQAAAKAEQELLEATKREEEARAAAQRLAAKREEQRRRNREWNNREQARQREEAQAKLTQEMQRRAQVEAQRAAMGRMAAQPPQLQTGTNAHNIGVPQQVSYVPAAGPPAMTVAREQRPASTQHHQGMEAPTHFLQSDGQIRPLGGYGSGAPPPSMQHPPHTPYPVDARHGEFNSQMGMDAVPMMNNAPPGYSGAFGQQHPATLSAMHGEAQVLHNLDGNAFEYAELGIEGQAHLSRSMIPTEDGTVSSAGSGRPPRDSHLVHVSNMPTGPFVSMPSSTPPPGFMTSPSTASISAAASEFSEEPNHLGEIRATAKAFVPTNFKPTSQPVERVASAPSPGEFLVPASKVTRSSSDGPLRGFGDVEQTAIEALDPVSSLIGGSFSAGSSSLLPAATTRLPAALDPSPVPSAASSVAGAPGSSSLLDPVAIATSSSVGGIWGTSGTTSTTTSGAPIGGLPTFGFGDTASSLGSAPTTRSFGTIENVFGDPSKDTATGGNDWGSGDASGAGGGNSNGLGSIW